MHSYLIRIEKFHIQIFKKNQTVQKRVNFQVTDCIKKDWDDELLQSLTIAGLRQTMLTKIDSSLLRKGQKVGLGVSICLDLISIKTLDLDTLRTLSWPVEKIWTFHKPCLDVSRLVSTKSRQSQLPLNLDFCQDLDRDSRSQHLNKLVSTCWENLDNWKSWSWRVKKISTVFKSWSRLSKPPSLAKGQSSTMVSVFSVAVFFLKEKKKTQLILRSNSNQS